MQCITVPLLSVFVLVLAWLALAEAEVFTALVDLEPLIETEAKVAKALGKYLELEERRLQKLRRIRTEYVKLYKAAKGNVENFLSNPLNAYVLLRRLTADWKAALQLVRNVDAKVLFTNLKKQKLLFPTEDDLKGSETAIIRLQDTYRLNASKLADGEIEGAARALSLSAEDCYELGLHAHRIDDHFNTVIWMQEALNRLDGNEREKIDVSAILELMGVSTFTLGNILHALDLMHKLAKHDPEHPRVYNYLEYYQATFMQMEGFPFDEAKLPSYRGGALPPKFQKPVVDKSGFPGLCRGEKQMTPKAEKELYCSYTSSNSKYLLLQPVKKEVLSLDPFIVMFHDIISDKDIEILKNISRVELSRSTIMNPKSGLLETASFRVSKTAWLNDLDHPRVAHSSKMIEEIVGLESDTADHLQIVNYGMGGHYAPHYDFRREGEAIGYVDIERGNRIATWMYYLSDVPLGGYTAFPPAGLGVKPKKGSATFWYNLHRSGRGDMKTIHGGCPVLVGSKWVANKWFRERGQEFRRRCSKNRFE